MHISLVIHVVSMIYPFYLSCVKCSLCMQLTTIWNRPTPVFMSCTTPAETWALKKIHIFPLGPLALVCHLTRELFFPSSWFCFMCCGKSLKSPLDFSLLASSAAVDCESKDKEMNQDFKWPLFSSALTKYTAWHGLWVSSAHFMAISCLHASMLFRCGEVLWSCS